VTPDDIYEGYGADTLRLYEMFMGPLDASRPWNTADIVGVHRFLQRFWRNAVDEETGAIRVSDASADEDTRRILHRTIEAVRNDMGKLQFNTAIARLFELNNRLTQVVGEIGAAPAEVVTAMTLMLAPLAPHMAEEVWARLGHTESLAYEPFPEPDPAYLVVEEVEIVVQVDGKVRARVKVPSGASEADHEAAARADDRIAQLVAETDVRNVIIVPGRLVNFVTR
jgi:leucyl-tRNA synthetase